MESKLKDQLAVAVEKGLELAEKTGSFVIEQAPDLIKQLILYNTVESALAVILGIVFLIAGFKVIKYIADRDSVFGKDEISPMWMFYTIPLIGGLALICNISRFLKCVLAPKIFLIEYFIK